MEFYQKEISLSLHQLASPVFGEESDLVCKNSLKEPDPDYERPLSSYIDIRDELLDIFLELFYNKPIWLKSDLLNTKKLKSYDFMSTHYVPKHTYFANNVYNF